MIKHFFIHSPIESKKVSYEKGILLFSNPFSRSTIKFGEWNVIFFYVDILYIKQTFLVYKEGKLPIFGQNHVLTPLEKSQFFHFFNFLFL